LPSCLPALRSFTSWSVLTWVLSPSAPSLSKGRVSAHTGKLLHCAVYIWTKVNSQAMCPG
jgi:hypothetical protein